MNRGDPIVFIVDDDPLVLRGLTRLLKAANHKTESFTSAQVFLDREHYDGPGCLVLDVQLPGLNGLELQDVLASANYHLPIIFITGYGDIPMGVNAMKAGAVDFLAKPFAEDDLLKAVSVALDKCERDHKERTEVCWVQERFARLTPREREVFGEVISGRLNKQIAGRLGTAEKTVKVHRARVMQKMQAQSLADLVRMAERAGIR